jgi:hypothetical protein
MNIHKREETDMAKSRTLSDTEKSFSVENSASVLQRRGLRREILLNVTDEIENLEINDEYIPKCEIQRSSSSKDTGDISFAPLELPLLRSSGTGDSNNFMSPHWENRSTVIDSDVQCLLIKILDIYECTRTFLHELESRSKYCFTELLNPENTLEFLAITLRKDKNKKKQLKILDKAMDDIQEASINATKLFFKETCSLLEEYLKNPPIYYISIFIPLPDLEKIKRHYNRSKHHMQMSKQLKDVDWESSLDQCRRAYIEALNLRNQLPDINEAKYKFLVTSISITSLAIGLISLFLWFLESYS